MKALVIKKDKRIVIYDIIRVIAIILVLIGHATYYRITSPFGGVKYKGYIFSDLYKFMDGPVKGIIYSFHMPLFIFVSGALFYKECSKNNVKFEEIVSKKFKKLIIPYITYGILYNIVIKFIARFYTLKALPYAVVFETLLGQNTVQYIWFLPTLFFATILFYIIYNSLMKKDIKKLSIFLIILSFFVDEIEIIFPGVKFLPLLFIFFSIGFIFEKYREEVEDICQGKNLILCIYFIIMAVLLNMAVANIDIIFIKSLLNCLLILVIILAIIFLAYVISKFKVIINNKIFNLMNKYSFDIYILGDPLNYIVLFLVSSLSLTHMYSTTGGTIMLLLIRTVGIAVMSIIIAYIIEKLKKLKYFKITIKVMIVLIIVLSCVIIMHDNGNYIELKVIK